MHLAHRQLVGRFERCAAAAADDGSAIAAGERICDLDGACGTIQDLGRVLGSGLILGARVHVQATVAQFPIGASGGRDMGRPLAISASSCQLLVTTKLNWVT